MQPGTFLDNVNDEQVVAAIRAAEALSTAQLRVFISNKKIPEPLPAARKQFTRLGMHKTQHHNAVLLFIAPQSQTFAILGDTAADVACGQEFWHSIRDEMTPHLKSANYTAALVAAVTRIGQKLSQHFPRTPSSGHPPTNELPDSIARP